jgi:hypothetical protein
MINITPEARLNIILTNTNKALSEAVKHATPEQLETLKEGKDIKSLLTSVFQDKATASKSDQTLLDLLKNSTVFKNMGSFSDDLKSLLSEFKNSPDLAPKTAVLEKFYKNITTVDPQSLKSQIADSGVFMESKFVAALQKLPDLTQTLDALKTALSKVPLNEAKTLQTQITALLGSTTLAQASENHESAIRLSDTIKKITDTLQNFLSKSDPLYSKEVASLAQKLEQLNGIQEIKTTLSQIYSTLLTSNTPDTNPLLDSIENLLKNLNTSTDEDLKAFTLQLKNAIDEGGNTTQELTRMISKLGEFTNPKELVLETFLKESLSNDLKSNLLALSEELQQSPDPAASKVLEQVDKLLIQIDYHQLISHLSSSNSIYFPFAWDQLEEGSLAFKKTPDKKFYCEINLKLKEYGELDLLMALYEGNQIEIQAHTEKGELKTLIHEHLATLRSQLIDAGLTPRSLRILERKEIKTPLNDLYCSSEGSDLGFEVTV